MKGYQFTKRELQGMDTIEQSWSGDELKIQNQFRGTDTIS